MNGITEKTAADKEYAAPLGVSGLGGWLILVQIGLYASIARQLNMLFVQIFPVILDRDIWEALTSKDSELYHVLWGPVFIYELLCAVLTILFIIFIFIQFYRRKSILPKLMITLYAVNLAFIIFDYVLVMQIPYAHEMDDLSSIRQIISSVITCSIWIPYFLKSERVENTFIR